MSYSIDIIDYKYEYNENFYLLHAEIGEYLFAKQYPIFC